MPEALLYFFSAFFNSFQKLGFLQFFFLLIYGIVLLLLSILLPLSPYHTFFSILSTIFTVKIVFRKKWAEIIYPAFLYLVSAILADVICGAILQINGFSSASLVGNGFSRIIYNSMCKILHLLFLYLIISLTNRRYVNTRILHITPLVSCLLFSFFACYQDFNSLIYEKSSPVGVIIETLGLLYINIIICAYVEILNRFYIKQQEANLAKQQLDVRVHYYEDLLDRQEETRVLWHDIKKYMATMETLVGYEKQEEAQKCLDEIRASFRQIEDTIATGNPIVDSILTYGFKNAHKHQVVIEPKIWVDSDLEIPASDLFIIMGNTIDNAIEACCFLPVEERIVSIILSQKNHIIQYEIRNKFSNTGTSKAGKIHGYGLKNVRTCVDRNGGSLSISKINEEFIVSIILNV